MVLAHHLLGDLFEQTFEGYPAPTLIVDQDVRVLLANRAARAVLGEGSDGSPILRMRGGDILHCIQSSEPGGCGLQALCGDCVIRRSVRLAYEHQEVQRCRADLEVRRGSKAQALNVLVSASPIEHDGERQVVLTLEDITEVVELAREVTQAEKEARETEARLATVVDNLAEGVVVATMEGEVIHWNPAALKMHGFQSVEECRLRLPDLQSYSRPSTRKDDASTSANGRSRESFAGRRSATWKSVFAASTRAGSASGERTARSFVTPWARR